MALLHARRQVTYTSFGPPRPLVAPAASQLGGERLAPCDGTGTEKGGGGVEVVAGQVDGLADGAHAVAEVEVLVPDRIPDAIGDGCDVAPAVVDQHDVDVA